MPNGINDFTSTTTQGFGLQCGNFTVTGKENVVANFIRVSIDTGSSSPMIFGTLNETTVAQNVRAMFCGLRAIPIDGSDGQFSYKVLVTIILDADLSIPDDIAFQFSITQVGASDYGFGSPEPWGSERSYKESAT